MAFKRAFKIKDFGDVIPGHGGMMDRFDCQFLMATFVNVYIRTFVSEVTPVNVWQRTLAMHDEYQVNLYHMLQTSFIERGYIETSL